MIYLGNSPVGVAISTGGITAYQKAFVSVSSGEITSNGTDLIFYHNLGIIPKFFTAIKVEGGTESNQNIQYMHGDSVGGLTRVPNVSSGGTYNYVTTRADTDSTGNGKYYLGTDKIKLHQNASTTHWDTGAVYSIELWG